MQDSDMLTCTVLLSVQQTSRQGVNMMHELIARNENGPTCIERPPRPPDKGQRTSVKDWVQNVWRVTEGICSEQRLPEGRLGTLHNIARTEHTNFNTQLYAKLLKGSFLKIQKKLSCDTPVNGTAG